MHERYAAFLSFWQIAEVKSVFKELSFNSSEVLRLVIGLLEKVSTLQLVVVC